LLTFNLPTRFTASFQFVQHPAGLSSLMFAFAALVVHRFVSTFIHWSISAEPGTIHSIFRTSHTDVTINETSSYVDLAPLYGVNRDAQKKVRRWCGRGLLLPDTFSEDRLLLLPPAVPALLVLFNRNHNVRSVLFS
jgi:linoleate 10R-lipoxygenase